MVKDMELQKLHGTIKALQKVVTDTGVVLEQERLDFNANLQDARRQIELLRLRDDMAVDDSDAASEPVAYDRRLLKDIQLDLVQTTSPTPSRSRAAAASSHRHHRRRNGSTEADKMPLGLWSVVRASRRQQEDDDDLRPPQSEASAERGRRSCSSEVSQLTVVKDLSVDKQELLPRPPATAMEAPHREWKKKVIERLSADAQRLVDLQSIVGELRASAEAAPELEDVTAQMVEAEAAVAQLIDTNGKLLRKAEEFTSADAAAGDDLRSRSQRKILERVRKMSEKIARLEQETQRFQHALLRHEEERATRRAAAAAASGKASAVQRRSSRVQLVEYLYGRRRDSRRQRRGPSCCMRAKAIDD